MLLIALCLTIPPSTAEVENVTYCSSLLFNSSGAWTGNHSLPLFDPSLGDLVGVNVTVDFELVRNFSFENLGSAPQDVDFNSSFELLVTTPDSDVISVIASVLVSEELAGFDGEEDYSGPSGRTIEGVLSESSKTRYYDDPADFIAAVPGRVISLPTSVSGLGGTTLPCNFVYLRDGSARSEVCVTYTYESKVPEEEGVNE